MYPTCVHVNRHLFRLETKQEGPPILHGRNPEELPIKQLDNFQENEEIFAAYTGPDSGLTAVNLQQKHLSISDTDIDYIDMLDQNEQYRSGESRITTFINEIQVVLFETNNGQFLFQDQRRRTLRSPESPIGLIPMKAPTELQRLFTRRILLTTSTTGNR